MDPLLGGSGKTDEDISKASSLTMSPSREQFFKAHSASPFAKDIDSLDDRLTARRKSSRSSATSWFKKLASPVVTNLMRSQTTGNFLKIF